MEGHLRKNRNGKCQKTLKKQGKTPHTSRICTADFESATSTNSIIPADTGGIIIHEAGKCKCFLAGVGDMRVDRGRQSAVPTARAWGGGEQCSPLRAGGACRCGIRRVGPAWTGCRRGPGWAGSPGRRRIRRRADAGPPGGRSRRPRGGSCRRPGGAASGRGES